MKILVESDEHYYLIQSYMEKLGYRALTLTGGCHSLYYYRKKDVRHMTGRTPHVDSHFRNHRLPELILPLDFLRRELSK